MGICNKLNDSEQLANEDPTHGLLLIDHYYGLAFHFALTSFLVGLPDVG